MMTTTTKHALPLSDEQRRLKKGKFVEPETYDESDGSVILNPADCDLDFDVEGQGLLGSALYQDGFAYCWSGARANIGITRGKYCFGCKLISLQTVDMRDTPFEEPHNCRVGFSIGGDPLPKLGETMYSFGFGCSGKFSNSGNFSDYGERFGFGDTIVCAVDLDASPMASIGFSKNGIWLGVAMTFDAGPYGLSVVNSPMKELHWESALFPHVLLKNVVVQMQFSVSEGLIPVEGYKPWANAIFDGNAVPGPVCSNQQDCEALMMVGLPASGKTTWAEQWANAHPEKRYVLLGTKLALEQMKLPRLLHKNNYGEQFELLMNRATKNFNVLLSRASRMSRNVIIDHINVYKNARKRTLKPFRDYMKIAVVVFPRAGELRYRAQKRFAELGETVASEALNQMIVKYTLPMSHDMPATDEYFDQVWFVELNREESQISLDEMKRDITVK